PEYHTDATLGDMQLRSHLLNAGMDDARGLALAYTNLTAAITEKSAAAKVSPSSLLQECAYPASDRRPPCAARSRLFSRSGSLRRFTCSVFSPPNSWRHLAHPDLAGEWCYAASALSSTCWLCA